jgi:lantibiotic biosynthesis protein
MAWESLLNGEEATAAGQIVLRLAAKIELSSGVNCSGEDLAERGLLFAYLGTSGALVLPSSRIEEYLIGAAERIRELDSPALFGGIAGAAWILEHLIASGQSGFDDPLGAVDTLLLEFAGQRNNDAGYDLIGGIVGTGAYFLERPCSSLRDDALFTLLERLEHTAEINPQGITWHTRRQVLRSFAGSQDTHGRYDLGVAHGVAGVLRFLGILVALGIGKTSARTLLNGCVHWLMCQEQAEGAQSRFPNWVNSLDEIQHSRIAWCYGDLGIGIVLWQTARLLGNPDWLQYSEKIIDRCIARGPDGIVDAGLCHGAVGVAHMFNRIYQQSGQSKYKHAAKDYYSLAIQLTNDKKNLPKSTGQRFIDGDIGIALGLLAACHPIEPNWDRRMLLSYMLDQGR